jgi:hypothetical protein
MARIDRISVNRLDLPQPLGPTSDELAALDHEVDGCERDHRYRASESLANGFNPQHPDPRHSAPSPFSAEESR